MGCYYLKHYYRKWFIPRTIVPPWGLVLSFILSSSYLPPTPASSGSYCDVHSGSDLPISILCLSLFLVMTYLLSLISSEASWEMINFGFLSTLKLKC